jgi:hypothetical protein
MSRNISPRRINKNVSMNCWFKIHINSVILIMCQFIKMSKIKGVRFNRW